MNASQRVDTMQCHESSEEVLEFIEECLGSDEQDAIFREWQETQDADAIIAVARELGEDEPLFWDCEV